jgi:hypothetical protein
LKKQVPKWEELCIMSIKGMFHQEIENNLQKGYRLMKNKNVKQTIINNLLK